MYAVGHVCHIHALIRSGNKIDPPRNLLPVTSDIEILVCCSNCLY